MSTLEYMRRYNQRPERVAAARARAATPEAREAHRIHERNYQASHREEHNARQRLRRLMRRTGCAFDLSFVLAATEAECLAPEEPMGPQDLEPGQHACSRCDLPTRRQAPTCGFCAAELVREAVAA